MKRVLVAVSIVAAAITAQAQNVGINTVAPSAYGHGGTNRLLEIYNPSATSNSQSHLILADSSISGSLGSVTWASKAISISEKRVGIIATEFDASANAASPKSYLRFYTHNGASITEKLTVNPAGNIGIGNTNPNAPLSFAPSLGKKITLYPGATGDVGLGVVSNRLQIYADNSNADVAIGYDAAGIFNERFAVKANGALAVAGNTGETLQLLISKGAGEAAGWTSAGNIIRTEQSGSTNNLELAGFSAYNLSASTYTVTLAVPSRVILYYKTSILKGCVAGDCAVKMELRVYKSGVYFTSYEFGGSTFVDFSRTSYTIDVTSGPDYFDLPAGEHTFTFTAINKFNQPTLDKFCVYSTIIPL